MTITNDLILEINDGRFGKLFIKIKEGYVAKFDPRSAKTDREFLDVIATSAMLMAVSILTSELTPAERLELKQMYLDKQLTLCDEVQKKKKMMKDTRKDPRQN